jgi:glycosyltransferase involved in cell wall biosynthesis
MHTLTVAFCTYKRADRLEKLVASLRAQDCPIPFEILAVNNSSPDNTLDVLAVQQKLPGAPLRVVTETAPGIVPARNRALAEAIDRDILVFIDDDELPQPGWLAAAYDAIANEHADCAGGRVQVDFSPQVRPAWMKDDLLGFLAEVDHGQEAFWIRSPDTPIWTANVAYAMRIFRDNPSLRFDARYNRVGADVGGGEDAIMFRALLELGVNIRYCPAMAVWHSVEPWRLNRRYFIRLHYRAGLRHGEHALPDYPRTLFGIPPFMLSQFLAHCARTLAPTSPGNPSRIRQAMNAAHALGCIAGYRSRP